MRCAICNNPIFDEKHTVFLQENGNRIDICSNCTDKIKKDFQYIACWQSRKRKKNMNKKSCKEILQDLKLELENLNEEKLTFILLKIFFLERQKMLKFLKLESINGKLHLIYKVDNTLLKIPAPGKEEFEKIKTLQSLLYKFITQS